MDIYSIKKIAHLLKVGIFRMEGENLENYRSNPEQNPIFQSEMIRLRLKMAADGMTEPYIYRDEFQVYFACIKAEEAYYLIGPMATEYLNRARRHEFYRRYEVQLDLDKNLKMFTLNEVLETICLLAKIITGCEYSDEVLVNVNSLETEAREEVHKNLIRYDLRAEEEESYRHSYQEERRLLEAVREGNVEEAVKRNKDMDMDIGKLSENDLSHWRNVLVIGATLCARAAIEGQLSPYVAYRISGYYINKGSSCRDVLQILSYRNQAVEELTREVQKLKTKRHSSSYTQQCKDYVRRHYREKIYLDDLAEDLGISSSYLSRLFKKEAGVTLQEYIVDIRVERAANLLVFSNESIPRIAEYVNFPSQSYFGRVFKEKKHMTPREYREAYKPTEFISKKAED